MFRDFDRVVVAAVALLVAAPLAAGPYSDATHGIRYNDPRFVGWATDITVSWPAGFTPFYNNPAKALGPAPATSNDVVTLGDCGTATLTFFPRAIRNTPGPDLAIFENGFNAPALPGTLFAELAYVEVSTNGDNYARFPSVSLNNTWPGEWGSLDPTNIYNLAGKHVNNNGQAWQGTPFDLGDLAGHALVLSGAVDLKDIRYVRVVDIYGHDNGTSTDSLGHIIYDGGNFGLELTGFDLDAVGILEALIGDANGDGKVDGGDLAIWQQNYDPRGRNAATNDASKGDFNGDGRIDGGDLALWQQRYDPTGISATSTTGGTVALDAVPEPATVFLFLAVFAAGVFLRRKFQVPSLQPNGLQEASPEQRPGNAECAPLPLLSSFSYEPRRGERPPRRIAAFQAAQQEKTQKKHDGVRANRAPRALPWAGLCEPFGLNSSKTKECT